jgi:uncharacterized protein (TIGR03435 family)
MRLAGVVVTACVLWMGLPLNGWAQAVAQEMNPASMDAVPAKISFDVVSFKRCPDGKQGNSKVDEPQDGDYIAYHCESIQRMIYFAYWGSVNPWSLEKGYPAWVDDERYEFIAKVAPEDIAAWQKLDLPGRRVLVRGVLATALQLKVSIDRTPETVYVLTVAKGGAKVTPYQEGEQTKLPDGTTQAGKAADWVGVMAYFHDYPMSLFVEMLTAHYDRRVVDHTGLTGKYNFAVPVLFGPGNNPNDHKPTEDSPSTAEGLSKLGLRLESAKAPVERIAVEHVERPAED